jgi:hypothetical protein
VARDKHYHVLVGMCGLYMPDSNVVFERLRDAQRYARDEADAAREQGDRVRKVPGVGHGYYTIGSNYCIEVTDCDQPECLHDLEE